MLQASQELFRRCFELSPIGTAITSPSKGCLEVNDALCRILGYPRHELLRRTWDELTHPDDLCADVCQFDRVVAGEIDGYTLDKRWLRKDGTIVYTIMSARAVRCADGSVDYFIGLVQDVTERRTAEEKIKESERRFQLLVESIPHHIWSFRADGTVGYCNRQMLDYTGYTEEEMRGTGGWGALHPDDVADTKAAWEIAYAQGVKFEKELRVRGRDGRYRRFVCRGMPVKNEQGRPMEWFGTNTDVEDHRQAEETLQKLQAELAHVARVTTLGEVVASIAHELNQPLTAIAINAAACARWLAAQPSNLPQANKSVECIVRDAHRAAGVIAQIRAFLYREPARHTAINVNEVIIDVLELVRGEMRNQGVSVQMKLLAKPPAVAASRTQLQQVILNLVLNAIESLSQITDRPRRLSIKTARDGNDALRVAVSDCGVGLASDQVDCIFDAFHTTKPRGLGMGLAISRSIVEAHGGRLWVIANDGPGVTFCFTLAITPHSR